jgi:hypothetical protein
MGEFVRRLAILFWFSQLLTSVVCLKAEDLPFASKKEFLELYGPISDQHEFLPPMSLVAEVTESKKGVQQPRREIRVYARDNLLRVDDDIEGGVQVSRVASPDQSFRAIRNNSSETFGIEPAGENLSEMLKGCRTTAPIVNPYYHFLETPIAEFLARSDVEIESSRRVVDANGEQLVEIDVSRVVYDESNGLEKWLYQFTFLPEKNWVLSKYRIGSNVEVRFFHLLNFGDRPEISRIEVTQKSSDDEGYIHSINYEVTHVDFNPPSLKEFTPAAFDAVSYDETQRSGVIVLLIAVVFIILGIKYHKCKATS